MIVPVLAAAGCREPSGPPWSELDQFGGELVVSVFEAHERTPPDMAQWWPNEAGDPRIALSVRMPAEPRLYNCGGELITEHSVDGAAIDVSVRGVVPRGGVCTGGPQPYFSVYLPVGEGEYTLNVSLLDHTDLYQVRITETAIELVPLSPGPLARAVVRTATRPDFPTFLRFPPRSFALYCYDPREPACAALVDEMRRRIGLEPLTFPEGGRLPYVEMEETPGALVRYFRYPAEPFPRDAVCALFLEHDLRVAGVTSWRGEHVQKGQC